jgi:cellulose synthase/poly-beta-1,6-N-acetylglucosamine synthase-like glycosyltransferase
MLNFLISIVVAAASVFLMILAVRYGLNYSARVDNYFISKANGKEGFNWYYRIPFKIGIIPEYFFAMILGNENYFNRRWWALKTSSFISVLLFIAMLNSRSSVYSYYSLELISESGIISLFTSGSFYNFLNLITLLYISLFVMICIESFRMYKLYAPVRIIMFSVLSLLMANITVITLSIIVFITIAWLVIKVIWFLFFSSKSKRKSRDEDDDESVSDIFAGGLKTFTAELKEWENSQSYPDTRTKREEKPKIKRKKPKIRRVRKNVVRRDDEIPKIYPD